MVVVSRPYRFDDDDPRPMLRHLDGWARRGLVSPEAWGSVVELCGQWADYSARNQVLLASYGIAGPVAGTATWERVPSTEEGRGCAVRVGEHGLPVRVPVVDRGEVASDRSRMGARTASVAGSHRWEPVFAVEQLARRPEAGALSGPVVPPMSDREWSEAVRQASGRMLGRTPRKVSDPIEQLAVLAGKVPLGAGRVKLSGELAAQAAWLVADRVGRGAGPMPAFDPSAISARERWRTIADVRHAAGRVLDAVSFAVGVDLSRSPLPRHDLVDDRVVAPERRNYLAPADVRALPLGVWVEAGPYTRAEWMARGVAGAVGVASFLRVNDRSYLAAYETRAGAMWRLETVGRGAHHGLVGEGVADDLTDAKAAVRVALAERFPDAARAVEQTAGARVLSPSFGWVPLPGGLDERTEQRVYDERVAAMVAPGPGGRWQTWVSVDGAQRQGPLATDAASAREMADGLAHGALLDLAVVAPDRANTMIADLSANADSWDRSTLVAVVGHRLTGTDRQDLATTSDSDRLVELMRNVGVLAPSTMLGVLHAEGVELDTAVALAPSLGMPIPDFIRQTRQLWDANALDVGTALGATVDELRAAGCTPTEMLAAAPREELRRLDGRESTWQHAAASLVEAGYSAAEAVEHLAVHAPTPAAFTAGVVTIVDRPVDAFAFASRRACVEDLVALSERFELSPAETAQTVGAAGVPIDRVIEILDQRCGRDAAQATELAARHLGLGTEDVDAVRAAGTARVVPMHPVAGRTLEVGDSIAANTGPDPALHSPNGASLADDCDSGVGVADLEMEITR